MTHGAQLVTPALLLSLALFVIGVVGVFLRRNVITVFMCVELMLNAVNLAFVAFSRSRGTLDGQVVWDVPGPLAPNGVLTFTFDVKIPDENILQKSRQILDELRRRAGERSRPSIELDYIDRLLKRF